MLNLIRTTFLFILNKSDHRVRKDFVVDAPVNPEKRIAIALYRLPRGDILYSKEEMVRINNIANTHRMCNVIIEKR